MTEEEVKAALSALKERMGALVGQDLVKLVLYGSRARGDAEPDSDVDVAIIVRGLDRAMKDRIFRAVAEIEVDLLVPLSTLVLSEADYHGLIERERRIALDIEKEGVPL